MCIGVLTVPCKNFGLKISRGYRNNKTLLWVNFWGHIVVLFNRKLTQTASLTIKNIQLFRYNTQNLQYIRSGNANFNE